MRFAAKAAYGGPADNQCGSDKICIPLSIENISPSCSKMCENLAKIALEGGCELSDRSVSDLRSRLDLEFEAYVVNLIRESRSGSVKHSEREEIYANADWLVGMTGSSTLTAETKANRPIGHQIVRF